MVKHDPQRHGEIEPDMPPDSATTSAKGSTRQVAGALAWLSAAQADRCRYCGCDTWLPWQRRQEQMLRSRWNMPASRSMACQLAFECRMATVEHLRRRADAGGDTPANLAMACAYCNSSRHDRSPESHERAMRALKSAGRHPCFPAAPQKED